jgi:putative transposase
MRDYQGLAHTTWDCKYHIVFIPKGRKKAIFGAIRHHLGQVLHELAHQKECKIVEGHLMRDHVHICISIPPKHSVSYVVGYIKGKSAISIARRFMGKTRNFTGENFWARGYFVSAVGLDEEMVRAYIRHQEKEDKHYDQLKLGM